MPKDRRLERIQISVRLRKKCEDKRSENRKKIIVFINIRKMN